MPNLNLARKVQCQGGWDWGICMPVSGLYGEVCLEGSNGVRIEHVYTEQKHTPGECVLNVTAEIDSTFAGRQKVKFTFDGNEKINELPIMTKRKVSDIICDWLVSNPKWTK